MNSTNSSNDPYTTFGYSNFVIIFSVKVLFCICACITNGSLILITFLHKNLHRPCHILIAATAFCTLAMCTGPMITLPIIVFGIRLIPLGLCIYLQLFMLLGSLYQTFFFTLIAVDRLFGVMFPIWYKMKGPKFYLPIAIAVCGVFVLYIVFLDFSLAMETPNKLVICTATDVVNSNRFWHVIIINIISVVAYIILWITIKNKFDSTSTFTRRIMRSVSVSFLMELFGYLTNNVARFVLSALPKDQYLLSFYISQFVGFNLLLLYLLYAPTFYMFSTDHRQAFQHTFKPFINKIKPQTTTQVQVLNVTS